MIIINPHIVGITKSWASNDITDDELGLARYVMFRKDRMGRRGGGVLLYVTDTIPAYKIQLLEEADCEQAIWCNLVAGHNTVTMGVVYRCPSLNKESNDKIQNSIREVIKGDCIVMGDFNYGNIQWNTLESTGVEDRQMYVPYTGKVPHSAFIRTNQRSKSIRFISIFAEGIR